MTTCGGLLARFAGTALLGLDVACELHHPHRRRRSLSSRLATTLRRCARTSIDRAARSPPRASSSASPNRARAEVAAATPRPRREPHERPFPRSRCRSSAAVTLRRSDSNEFFGPGGRSALASHAGDPALFVPPSATLPERLVFAGTVAAQQGAGRTGGRCSDPRGAAPTCDKFSWTERRPRHEIVQTGPRPDDPELGPTTRPRAPAQSAPADQPHRPLAPPRASRTLRDSQEHPGRRRGPALQIPS